MRADHIIKNAKIFTADKDHPQASALAVKDGKFVYVGDEAGLSAYEGEVTDLGGKFIMPGILDTHVHVTMPVGFLYADIGTFILECTGKKEVLDFIADYVSKNPGLTRYRFVLEKKKLNGDELSKEDLDRVCPDAEVQIQEGEGHSIWVNSKLLERHGITDDTPDPVPGLSYYVRKDGHVTGNIIEGTAEMPIILDSAMDLTDEQIDAALQKWIDYSESVGVTAVFDAGIPGDPIFHERVYKRLRELDRQGRLPVYVDGCYVIAASWQAEEGLRELKRFREEYNTEHLKVHTLKIFMDGTIRIHTGAMTRPYVDVPETGTPAFNKDELAAVLKQLNAEGLDLHLHTVGDNASRIVLDAVEMVKKELKDSFRIKVTCAHLEVQADEDIPRFAELGVFANYTPHWHAGLTGGDAVQTWTPLLGEKRATHMYRCKSVWDTGAVVTWSSDTIAFLDFMTWNPFLSMEIGMTRWTTEKTKAAEMARNTCEFPPAEEKMSVEEMILGYTINGAKQLGIEDKKGSIEAGKDADFLVFDNDLLTAEHEGFSYNKPSEVYYAGKKVN